jgi:Flp pilus assembly protein TadD
MRTLSIASVALGLFLQIGCASTMGLTAQRRTAPNARAAVRFVSARQLEADGKLEQAREIYQELHDKHPKHTDYTHRLAVVCTRLQRHGEASSFYEEAHSQDPKDFSLLVDMGYSSYLKGDDVDAEQRLRESLHLKPGNPRATSNLALVLGRQGKLEESLTLLRQAGNEANALCSLAYIHSQRGEMDLAERRYQESLAIDPDMKQATLALAELAKRGARHGTTFEEVIATPDRPAKFIDAHVADFDAPTIQQAHAETVVLHETEETSGVIMTPARFSDDSLATNVPKLLEENTDIERLSPVDDEEWTNLDTQTPSASPVSHLPATDPDDWANDEPAATTSPLIPTSPAQADPAAISQTGLVSRGTDSSATRMTFGPPKSHIVRRVPPRAKVVDHEFPLPKITPGTFD